MVNAVITGCGAYLPEKILTNKDIEKMVETSDEWIIARTGIKQRHIAANDELTSHMAAKAAGDALKNAGIDAEKIDFIIVATTTPDKTFPATAVNVQKIIGASNAAAFDVQAVCSGFVYAMTVANGLIKSGMAKNILVIGADKMSSIVDWNDRGTCILFGDGAGAVVLSASNDDRGIIGSCLYSDGNYQDILYTNGGAGSTGDSGKVHMTGQEVFKHAVEKMTNSIKAVLEKNNLKKEDIAYLVPHQANLRILDMVGKKLRLPEEKLIATVENHANTSAASIPLAITQSKDKFTKGDLIVLTAIGGGLAWGSLALKW